MSHQEEIRDIIEKYEAQISSLKKNIEEYKSVVNQEIQVNESIRARQKTEINK